MALENAEFEQLPEDVSDVGDFHNDSQRGIDLQDAMMGEAHQAGGRHDLESRGFTTDTVGQDAQALYEQNLQIQQMQQPQLDNEAQFVQEQNWKQEYGRSENEKGELRRQLQELQAQMAQMQQTQVPQQFAPPLEAPQFFGPAPEQVQPVQPQPAPVVQPAPGFNFDPSQLPTLVEGDGDEMISRGEVDSILREKVAPFIAYTEHLATQARQQANQAQERLYEEAKSRRGITPQVEQGLLRANPWLQQMRDPNAYLNALSQLMQTTQQAPNPVVQPQQVQPQQRQSVSRVARRLTHIESGGSGVAPDSGRQSQQALWEQKWAETLRLPYGSPERTKVQRELLEMRHGSQVSGYRDPSILTK